MEEFICLPGEMVRVLEQPAEEVGEDYDYVILGARIFNDQGVAVKYRIAWKQDWNGTTIPPEALKLMGLFAAVPGERWRKKPQLIIVPRSEWDSPLP